MYAALSSTCIAEPTLYTIYMGCTCTTYLLSYTCCYSQALYSSYISDGCDKYIDCPVQLCGIISSNLWPAYEDLFDAVEEHALALLLIPWLELCSSEDRTFQEVGSYTLFPHEQHA